MIVEKLSDSEYPEVFLENFAKLDATLNQDYPRPRTDPASTIHLLSVFEDTPKELVLVQDDHGYCGRVCVNLTRSREDTVFFGFLEYDRTRPEILALLMHAVEGYANLNNRSHILGPIDLNVWLGYRFKQQGFDDNRSWEPTTPPEYLEHIQVLDYRLDQDYLTAFYPSADECFERSQSAYEKVVSEGYGFRQIDLNRPGEVDLLYSLTIGGFSENYFYESITREQYELTYVLSSRSLDLQYSFFLINPAGQEVGYLFAYLDSQQSFVIKSLIVHPDYRGGRLSSALVHRTLMQGVKNGIKDGCGACVRRGNVSEYFFHHLGERDKEHLYTLVAKDIPV